MTTHHVAVALTGGRYGYTPTCSCGWVTRGYVAAHAAQTMADDHKERPDAEQAPPQQPAPHGAG